MKSGMPGTVDGTLPGVDLSPGAGSWMELGLPRALEPAARMRTDRLCITGLCGEACR